MSVLAHREGELRRVRSAPFLLAACVGAALVLPWLVRQHLVFGSALVGFATASQQLQAYLPDVAFPWYFYLRRLPSMLSRVTTVALLAGLVWGVWRRDGVTLTCALVVAGILAWFSAYRYKEVRLVSAILPFVAIVAAAGVVRLVPGARSPRWGWAVLLGLGALVFVANGAVVRPILAEHVAVGYPSLLQASRALAERSEPGATVMTASGPQVFWYADRRVVDFPERRELEAALACCDWVVITSFERGQKPYVSELARTLPGSEATDDVVRVADQQDVVLLVRASLLRRKLP